MPTFKVPEMTCGHCVATIEKAIKGVDAAAVVQADLKARTVAVTTALPAAGIAAALQEAGYDSEALPG